jgi:hypothetical protein
MMLDIEVPPSTISFTEPKHGGPYPLIVAVGTLTIRMSDGRTPIESPNVVVSLDNTGKIAADVLGHPLRATATLYNDDGSQFFSASFRRSSSVAPST